MNKFNFILSTFLLFSFYGYSASLISVSPATAIQGQNLTVTITGLNTHFNQASCTISLSQGSNYTYSNINSITKISDTSIQAEFSVPDNAPIGKYDLNLDSDIDGSLTLIDGFQINTNPIIRLVSVSPPEAKQGKTLDITITGANTHFSQVNSTISLRQTSSSTIINSGTITKISDTSIKASFTIPANTSLGNYDVKLSNSLDGNLSISNGFQVLSNPELVSVSPAVAIQGQTLTVTITGLNTHFNQASSTNLNKVSTNTYINSYSFTKISDTSIQVEFIVPDNAPTGKYDINLFTYTDGFLTLIDGFQINTNPTIRLLSVSPSTAKQGQTLDITITGANTHFNQVNSTISLNQTSSSTIINSGTITKISDTSIKASFTIPANASIGNYNVKLNNSLDGNLSISNGFQIETNTALVSVSPASAIQGQTLTVTITGLNTHFNQTSGSISFRQASNTIINSNSITKISDTSIQAEFSVPGNSPTGKYDINLYTNTDGSLTLIDGFQINTNPTIRLVSVSQSTAMQGQTLDITITGSYTHFNQVNSTISLNQTSSSTIINSGTITKISDTSIKASFTIPASASIGNYDVKLSNSLDGNLSISNGFTVKLITSLVSVSPAVAIQGQTLTVTITGLNTQFNQASSTNLTQVSSNTYIPSNSITKISDTSIQAEFTVPINAPTGKYDLNLYSITDGYLTLIDGFQINTNPTIRLVSVSPGTATPDQTLDITITGANTHFNQVNSTISLSQTSSSTIINSGTITKISNTTIKASFTIPANVSLGNYDVKLSNSVDGNLSISNGFTISPIFTNISNKSVACLAVYLNPLNELLILSEFTGVGLITIFDLDGKIRLTKQVIQNENISVSTLSKGMFILKLETKDGILTQKIIKK